MPKDLVEIVYPGLVWGACLVKRHRSDSLVAATPTPGPCYDRLLACIDVNEIEQASVLAEPVHVTEIPRGKLLTAVDAGGAFSRVQACSCIFLSQCWRWGCSVDRIGPSRFTGQS